MLNTISHILLWCFIINTALLMIYFLMLTAFRDLMYKVHSKCFRVTPETFDSIQYVIMGFYKMFIFFFNILFSYWYDVGIR